MAHKEIEEFAQKVAQQQDAGIFARKQRSEIEILKKRISELEKENLQLKKARDE